MFNKKRIFLTILIFVLSISAVSANENLTNDTAMIANDWEDEIVEIDSEGNFTDLSNLIRDTAVNGTLELDKDYKYDLNSYYSGIEIRKSMTIDGKGHSIDGAGNARVFQIYSNVILKDIIFKNAYTEKSGGALYLEGAYVQIINCTFNSNKANVSGGAIYSTSSSRLNITECTFTNNTGYGLYVEGGAVYLSSSKANVTGSKFFGNSADSGGAIFALNVNLNILSSEFAHNVANWYGGSVFSDSILNINTSTFRNNKAGLKGGAVHSTASFLTENDYLIMDNSILFNNSAVYGGAISSSNVHYNRIYNSQFYSNTAVYGAVFARLSVTGITIINTSCYENRGVNGSVIFAPSSGTVTLENSNFTNNTGEYGCLVYTIQGRIDFEESAYNIIINKCNIFDNDAKNSLIYQFYGNIKLNNSSLVYKNDQYPVWVIDKLAKGTVNYQNNWWGVDNPDFDRLIHINNTVQETYSNSSVHDDGEDCSSNIIQIDENHTVISFRRDSTSSLALFIGANGEIRQEKFDSTFFLHVLTTANGWVVGSGGVDSPYKSEKLEAIAKIMIGNNNISLDYLNLIYKLKSEWDNFGHFIIKALDGRYGAVDYFNDTVHNIETGVLKSGEYFLCPNDYSLHRKGNISDLIDSDYVAISRYISAIDLYGSHRTTIQTYEYKKEVVDDKLITRVDCYVSNDDGHLANKNSSVNYLNDIFSQGKYVLGENIPIIMDGMFVNSFILDTVNLPPVKTVITVNNLNIVYNKGKYLIATLKDVNGNVLRNADVSISLNGKTYNRLTDSNGQVKLFVDLPPKTYTAIITFAGNSKYIKSTASSKIVVKKAKVKLVAKKKTFKKSKKVKKYTVTLKNNCGKVMKKVTIKLKVNGKTYKAKTSKKGKATFKIKLTKKGTFKAKLRFAGNKYYYALTKTVKIKVKR